MITYINEKNARDYEVLFSDATNALYNRNVFEELPEGQKEFEPYHDNGFVTKVRFEQNPSDFYLCDDEGNVASEPCSSIDEYDPNATYYVQKHVDITTLEQYFSVLGDLLKIDEGNTDVDHYEVIHSLGRRFTMLPLDEEVFEVNANTKEIKVPDSFRKSGVAVQGDDLAEVVYFEIDRFFDATDLDTCECYIQWETAKGDLGASIPWVIDIESKPNKMIIGWVLSRALTENPGNIKFSLRFHKFIDNKETNTKELVYSFSTLTATAEVKKTLSLDIENEGQFAKETITDRKIINRIDNSHTKVTNVTPIADAVWDDPTIKDVTYFDLDENMVYHDNGDGTQDMGAVAFYAQAHSVDGGTISYGWRKIDKEGSTSNLSSFTDEWVPLSEAYPSLTVAQAIESKKNFYRRDLVSNKPVYKKVMISDATTQDELMTYFEKQSRCVIGTVGTYVAVATNRKGFSTKAVQSPLYIIPEAEMFTKTNIYDEAYKLPADGSVVLAIEIQQHDDKYPTDGVSAHQAVLTYEWFKNGELIEGENESSLNVSTPGWYRVKVTNTRNEVFVDETYHDAYVALEAKEPVLAYPTANVDIMYADIEADAALTLDEFKVAINYEPNSWFEGCGNINEFICGDQSEFTAYQNNATGRVEYQWYKVSGDKDHPEQDGKPDTPIANAILPAFDPRAYKIDGEEIYNGLFYCAIKNVLANGSEATTYSPIFELKDNR